MTDISQFGITTQLNDLTNSDEIHLGLLNSSKVCDAVKHAKVQFTF